jgi:hypothetical protein
MNLIDILKNYIFEQDSNQNDQIKEIVDEFYDTSNFENVFSNLIKAYDVYKGMSMANTKEEKEKAKDERDNSLINLVLEISRFTDNPEEKEAIVEDIVKNKVQNNDRLAKNIKLFYENYKDVKPPSSYSKITRKERYDKSTLSYKDMRAKWDKKYKEKTSNKPEEVKGNKSKFKKDSVHKIIIKTPYSKRTKSQWITIYRKLSDYDKSLLDEYSNLNKTKGTNYTYLDENGNEYPDSDNHKQDIYVIAKKTYSVRLKEEKEYGYYCVLDKNKAQEIKKLQEDLINNKTIEKGFFGLIKIETMIKSKTQNSSFYNPIEKYKVEEYISELKELTKDKKIKQNKEFQKNNTKVVTLSPEIKDKIYNFYDVANFKFPALLKAHNDYRTSLSATRTKEEKDKYKDKRDRMIIELIAKVTNFTDKLEEQEAIVGDIVTNKIPSDSNLLA